MGGLNYCSYLLKWSPKMYWNLFKWFLGIEIPTFSCICPSSHHMKRQNIFLEFWNMECWFNIVQWNSYLTKSSYLPALLCLEIYFKLSLTFELLDESSSAAKYSFLTYLYQSFVMFLIKMPKDQICFHAVGWSKEPPWWNIMIYGRLWTAIKWYFPYKDIWTKSDIFAGSGLEPGGHYVHEGTTLLSHQQLRGRIAGEVGILNNHHGDQDSGDDNDKRCWW